MKKICSKCKINKDLEDYHKCAASKDGKLSKCKSCNIAASKKYYAEHKQKIAEYKAGRKQEISECKKKKIKKYKKAWMPILKEIYGTIACIECGYSKCFAALEFHHRKPKTKKFSITTILKCKVTPERIKEIKKCEILCANCHRELHNGQ